MLQPTEAQQPEPQSLNLMIRETEAPITKVVKLPLTTQVVIPRPEAGGDRITQNLLVHPLPPKEMPSSDIFPQSFFK